MKLRMLADPAFRAGVAREVGREIEFHEVLDSTQKRARALIPLTAIAVVADHQTEGRGTRDRVWHAAPGQSLLCSWVYPSGAVPHATLAAGVAVVRAIESFGDADPSSAVKGAAAHAALKWPNDVLFGGRKVAGALAHVAGDPATLVIGIGVNVHQAEADFPAELRGRSVSVRGLGIAADRLALFVRLSHELDAALADPGATLRLWRDRSPLLGREVVIDRVGQPQLRGIVRDLASDGALILETPYGRERILAGEVVSGE